MSILPIENKTFHTNLSPEEVLDKLKGHVQPHASYRNLKEGITSQNLRAFEGHINANSFIIKRLETNRRNDMIPEIEGKISKGANGAKIELVLELEPFVINFLLAWYLFMAVVLTGFIYQSTIFSLASVNGLVLIFMIISPLVATHWSFNKERDIAYKLLQNIFQADKV